MADERRRQAMTVPEPAQAESWPEPPPFQPDDDLIGYMEQGQYSPATQVRRRILADMLHKLRRRSI